MSSVFYNLNKKAESLGGSKFVVVIGINTEEQNVLFLYKKQNEIIRNDYHFDCEIFSDDFYKFLGDTAEKYLTEVANEKSVKIIFVLPSRCIFYDNINIPVTKEKSPDKMLDISLSSLYKNRKELILNTQLAYKDKTEVIYHVVGVRKTYVQTIKAVFSSIHKNISSFTYGTVGKILALNNITKPIKGTRVLLDVDKNYSKLIYSCNGIIVGCLDLAFGYQILEGEEPVYEKLCYNHGRANELVEFAKNTKSFNKEKIAKESKGKAVSEPVTLFTKNIILAGKSSIDGKAYSKPTSVIVNVPKKFEKLFIEQNEFKEENGFEYEILVNEESEENIDETNIEREEDIQKNLSIYGGLFIKNAKSNDLF